MAKQTIAIGSSANDGTGDPLRTAFDKVNDNFDELYAGSPLIIAASAVQVPLTGTTAETTLATIPIPAGAMGPNGWVEVDLLTSHTNSANNKVVRVKFGGTTILSGTLTTTASFRGNINIANRNSLSSQVSANLLNGFGATSAALVTAAVDTSAAVNLLITGQLASAGESLNLERYIARVFYKA